MITKIERVVELETMQWVFKNMMRWEKENFPKGSWLDQETIDTYWHDYEHYAFHVALAWTQHGLIKQMSGFVSWYFSISDSAWINNIWVRPDHHGQGIGYGLLIHALEGIRYEGYRPHMLVIEDNVSMLRLADRARKELHFDRRSKSHKIDYYGNGRPLWYLEYKMVRK